MRSTGYLTLLSFFFITVGSALASDLDDVRNLYNSGNYTEAEAFAAEQVKRGIWNENWPKTLIRCQLIQGKAQLAKEVYEAAIKRYPTSLSLRLLGIDALRQCGLHDEAIEADNQMLLLMKTAPSRYASRDNLVAMGQYFTQQGEDARQILELFYDRVRDSDPTHLGACLASTELALSKSDFKVAAEVLKRALEIAPNNPEVHYYLARTWGTSDAQKSNQSLNRALELNPKHLASLLLKAESAIDSEQYTAAELILDLINSVNPNHQQAHALRAVLAHLRGDFKEEKVRREKALATWAKNPQIDHLIGRKLSDKYRFSEGAAYQRKSLELDSGFIPAKFQLAQDLLRLGHDEVGWELARQVADQDPYNVVAVNLLNLNQRITSFDVIESDGISVKMSSEEAAVYGQQVILLLTEAKKSLCEKYQIEPDAPIVVEIFPDQKDFAIRTFGLPGGAGFLGVCFGRVITANSPASQGQSPSNWQSVLWHEFCHVVTLEKTKNRMPRWLSEGISVYEEKQRDASWGEKINPIYREMLLGDTLTPVSELSGAFLNPPSPIHLQFAYYEASLVVEFIINRHGFESLLQILESLADGLPTREALESTVGSVDKLDAQFQDYAHEVANTFGADADWSRETLPEKPSKEQLLAFASSNPEHYWGLRTLAETLVAEKQYEQAKPLLEKLDQLQCLTGQSGDPIFLLAKVHQELGEIEKERNILNRITSLSSDSLPALTRLSELAESEKQWTDLLTHSEEFLAVDPLRSDGHKTLALAASELQQPKKTLQALSALASMSPIDPALIEYQLAKTHLSLDDFDQAKTHAMLALEEAPRYRDAHRLLLEIVALSNEMQKQSAEEIKSNPTKQSPPDSEKPFNNSATEEKDLGKSTEAAGGEPQVDSTQTTPALSTPLPNDAFKLPDKATPDKATPDKAAPDKATPDKT